ncbi:MAG: hypothetical protein HY717_19270 [Planctomycetes bacterium]|nr:hypothetical protein [Planctomycetota bacterium]
MPLEFTETGSTVNPANALSEFIQLYSSICQKGATGSLRAHLAGGAKPALLFIEGKIVDMDPADRESLLVQAILATGKVSQRDFKKAVKLTSGRKEGPALGVFLFEQNLALQEEILEKLQEVITNKICDLFNADLESVEFVTHQADERLEDFISELGEIFELQFDPEDFFLEAMRRQDRWDLVEQKLDCLWDIYYATPAAMRYYGDSENFQKEIALLSKVDGVLDLGEVIAKVSSGPFEAFQILKRLIQENDLAILSPVQVFQLGTDAFDRKDYRKAWKSLKRALDRGLNDFDIRWKLAEASAALGNIEQATVYYQEFAASCLSVSRTKEAARAYQKAAELNPLNAPLQHQILKLFIEQGRKEEAVVQGLTAAESLASAGNAREALDLLIYLKNSGLHDFRLKNKILDLAESCGDQEMLRKELESNPEELAKKLDLDEALKTFQRLFCEGNDSMEIRLKLAELHLRKGNRKKVLEHLNSILGTPLESQVGDPEILAWLHKTRLSLVPGHIISARWLAETQLKAGKKSEAIATYQELIRHLGQEKETYPLLEAYRRLTAIDGDQLPARFQLAQLYNRLGKFDEYQGELEKIAKLAAGQKDVESLKRAWVELLRTNPFIRNVLFILAEALQSCGQKSDAAERFKLLGGLDLLSDQLAGAEEGFKRALAAVPADLEALQRLGRLQRSRGDKEKALDLLVQASRLCLERRELHSARETIGLILADHPQDPKGLELKKELDRLEAVLKGEVRAEPKARSDAPPPPPPRHAAAPAASAVAPVPAPAAAPAPSAAAPEPFQPRPAASKGTVAAITARLRNMKSGGGTAGAGASSAPPSKEAAAEGHKAKGIRGAASKLKALANLESLTKGPEDAPPAKPPAAQPPLAPAEPAVKAGKPGSVAVRQDGSLAIRKAAGDAPVSPEALEKLGKTAADPGVKIQRSLGGSASKLAQLRQSGGQPAQPQ